MVEWPFEREPRSVQVAALEAGHMRRGYGYFMRMRMGKTGTVLADYELHRRAGRIKYAIIVVPNSLKRAWIDALGEWGLDLPRCMFEAKDKTSTVNFFRKYKEGVFVINYDSVDYFFDKIKDPLKITLKDCMLICDESTSFKDAKTKRSKTILKHAQHFAVVRILTGKPKANSNIDLWSQLKSIGAVSMGWFGFRNTFCVMGGWEGRQVVGDKNTEWLKELIADNGFVAGDEYLKDLPPKIYMPLIEVELTAEQKRAYKEMERDFFTTIEDSNCTASIALVKYLRLRQLTSGIFTGEGLPTNMMPWQKNPRILATMELLSGSPNKTLIIANFINSLDSLYRACQEAGLHPAMLTGGMLPKDIEDEKRAFNEEPACRVMIGQEAVMQFGHMLAAQSGDPCDTIIFYENDFSLINRAQSEARPEVLGRKTPIAIYDFTSSEMDRHIIKALREKENAAIALMGYARSQGVLPFDEASIVKATDKEDENSFLQQCALNDALSLAYGF